MMEVSVRRFTFCILAIIIIVLLFWQLLYLIMREEDVRKVNLKFSEPKVILLYEVPKWMETVYVEKLDVDADCVITVNKNYFSDIKKYDALVFSGQENWTVNEVFPAERSPYQYYIFADLECPFLSRHKFLNVSTEIYNLTMTYRRDSDIYWPYGFISNQDVSYISDPQAPIWKSPIFEDDFNSEVIHKVKKKKKLAAWFVSNCYATSGRKKLAEVMKKHMDIDIYGKCGTLRCDRSNEGDCYRLVEERYYFYLSFENSLCNDYITEKVFNVMQFYIVPVVYGGANYSNHLPPHSYINANDFESATKLATYLKNLTTNIDDYMKYFWWKKHYKVTSHKTYNNLCRKLHEFSPEESGQLRRSYENMNSWFVDGQCTTKPKIQMK
ncbi:alpha-(1,3)-fucosyltransferase C-like [Phlebotomus papatasi]|uniref:alpha-(1,3)-fucosyltransferase C-like n=1 Tax=Phlebotomus papatasi TaxID=29031 RepID=UPI002484119F|nr:alpha-(1,3)-fucosyltransferase C-like [Phlebotomus papatasi]